MDLYQKFWDSKYDILSEKDKISKHSTFVEFCIDYFPKTGRVLELGTWGGEDALFLSRKGYSIVATDFSKRALKSLKKKVVAQSQKNINIAYLDIRNLLPFSDNSFDIVYANLVVHYFNRHTTKQIFDEIFRVLKSNGIIAITVSSLDDSEYSTGKKIEEDYFQLESGSVKRYFSMDSLRSFIYKFRIIILDNQGTDIRRNYQHLIRFIGKKN